MVARFWVESIHNKSAILKKIRKAGFAISRKKPDFVLTYGGDGNILVAESKYPGVPKIPVRKSKICSKCEYYDLADLDTVLKKIKQKKYALTKAQKVEAIYKGKKIFGLNEVQIRNKDIVRALRFELNVNGKPTRFIADGIVASTPFGSTAYYKALGYKPFTEGIRIGLNNPAGPRKYFPVKKKVKVRILRETALLGADNQKKVYQLKKGDTVIIRKAKQGAHFARFL